MSKNTSGTGSDGTKESEGTKIRDATSQVTAADAVIAGGDARSNQTNFQVQKGFQNQEGPSEHDMKAVQPGESLEQYQKRVQAVESNRFEITGMNDSQQQAGSSSMLERYGAKNVLAQADTAPPLPKRAEPEYMPGYTKTEAEARVKEIGGKDSMSIDEIEFLRNYDRKRSGRADPDEQPIVPKLKGNATETANPAELAKPHEVTKPHDSTKPFVLDVAAEKVLWDKWQERMNQEIHKKLDTLIGGTTLHVGAEVNVAYSVGPNGQFAYKTLSNDPVYGPLVKRAIDETLRFHPDLTKFPEGSTKSVWNRRVHFGVESGSSKYSTGECEFEFHKK